MGIKDRSGNHVRFITYLIIIILINVAGISLFFRIDLTSNNIYSLSKASQEVVSTLSEPLTINLFFTKNLPAPHNNTEKYLHDLLEEYAIYGNKYLNYRFYDVSAEEGGIDQDTKKNQELAESYGIHPVQIQAIEKDEVKFQRAYMGLVLIHGDIIERIPTITSTDRLEYQLTTAIQRLNNKISALLRLSDKIKVKLFLSSSLEAVAPFMRIKDLSELPEKIKDIVEKLNMKSYGKLEFQHLDPSEVQGLEKEMEEYDIMSLSWQGIPEKNISPGNGSIGLVMEHGKKVAKISLLNVLRLPIIGTHYELVNPDNLEDILNENMESLIDINEDIGYLADHGSPNLTGGRGRIPGMPDQESLSNFYGLASQTYNIKSVSLSDGIIPEGINCLVIAGPNETFTDYELFQIDQFLMKGKTLALFLDRFTLNRAAAQQFRQGGMTPLNTGIEKLLEHYGIGMKESYILDENCIKQEIMERFGGGEKAIYFIPIIMNRFINNDLPIMKNIKGLVVSKVSPLALNPERIKANGLRAQKLFASSDRSWEMKGVIDLNPMTLMPPGPNTELKSMPLAYILDGEFPSYFAGKPIPEKESKEKDKPEKTDEQEQVSSDNKNDMYLSKIKTEGMFLPKGKPGKIFLIASSDILKDYIIDPQGKSNNATFILNLIDYLNNREAIAVMRSKENSFNPLSKLSGGAKAALKYFNIIGLPVLVVLFGLVIWFRRHHRKKDIRMMFQK